MSLSIRARWCALAMITTLATLTTGCLRENDRCASSADCFAAEQCTSTGRCVPLTSVDMSPADMSASDMPVTADMGADMIAEDMGEAVCPACPDGACCVAVPADGAIAVIRESAARIQSFVTREGRIYALITHGFGQVQLASWDGSAWSIVQVINPTPDVETAAAVLDAADTLHIVYVDKDGRKVLYRTFDASGLGQEREVYSCQASFMGCSGALGLALHPETQRPVVAVNVARGNNEWSLAVLAQRMDNTWGEGSRQMLGTSSALRVAHLGDRVIVLNQLAAQEPNARLFEVTLDAESVPTITAGSLGQHYTTKTSQVALVSQGDTSIFAAAQYNFEEGMQDKLSWARDAGTTNEISDGPYASPQLLKAPGSGVVRMVYLKQQPGEEAALAQRIFPNAQSGPSAERTVKPLPLASVDRPLLSVATHNGRDAHVFYKADGEVRYAHARLP